MPFELWATSVVVPPTFQPERLRTAIAERHEAEDLARGYAAVDRLIHVTEYDERGYVEGDELLDGKGEIVATVDKPDELLGSAAPLTSSVPDRAFDKPADVEIPADVEVQPVPEPFGGTPPIEQHELPAEWVIGYRVDPGNPWTITEERFPSQDAIRNCGLSPTVAEAIDVYERRQSDALQQRVRFLRKAFA